MSDSKYYKGRSSRHDSDQDDDEYSKKRSKKSKKKDKHKDKSKDKEKSKDRKKERKEKESEMTAIEKFNLFKKQRESAKGDDTIVDDLFKDFIASKLKQIESDNNKNFDKNCKEKDDNKTVSSVDEMNKFLDDEINNIALPTESPKKESCSKSVDIGTSNKVNVSVIDNPAKLGSLLKGKRKNTMISLADNQNVSKNGVGLQNELMDPPNKSTSAPRKANDSDVAQNEIKINSLGKGFNEVIDLDEKEKTVRAFGPHLPKLPAPIEKKENTEDGKVEVKKPLGFKNFGIKLSATSAELIQSGELHKKGKRLEDGKLFIDNWKLDCM